MVTTCWKTEREGAQRKKEPEAREGGLGKQQFSRSTARLEIPLCINSHREIYLQGTNHFFEGCTLTLLISNYMREMAIQGPFQGWSQGSLGNSEGHLLSSSEGLSFAA